ncbi:MAG: GNAT family N-acetyltransferase [Spirochaetes bacterium]|nr:GNAT family N-acetyltransferase [Spirochaetota bacterium]
MNTKLRVGIHSTALEIPTEQWNALVKEEDIPFLEWEWFAALEGSKSICPETGWQPCHISLWDGANLAALAPLYIKNHSWGEFVFDYFWAEAAQMLRRSYYPKLVGVIPATPVVGYRFLTASEYDPLEMQSILLEIAEHLCRSQGIHGIHFLFAEPSWGETLPKMRFIPWKHHHYLWKNQGFKDFSQYLSIFTKYQRKNIRKERKEVADAGIQIRVVAAKDADQNLFQHMFRLYTRTNDKFAPYDARYVNEEFFLTLHETFRHRILFVQAYGSVDSPIALAFLVQKGTSLWGRYWGTYQEIKDLHFDVCYYTPIQYAIERGIRTIDAGAGSPHKVRRGFLAHPHYSYHWLMDPLMDQVFRMNIDKVNQMEEETIQEMNRSSPLKSGHPF